MSIVIPTFREQRRISKQKHCKVATVKGVATVLFVSTEFANVNWEP